MRYVKRDFFFYMFVVSLKCSPTHAVGSKFDFTPFFFSWLVRYYDIEIYRIVDLLLVCPVNNNRTIYILRTILLETVDRTFIIIDIVNLQITSM